MYGVSMKDHFFFGSLPLQYIVTPPPPPPYKNPRSAPGVFKYILTKVIYY